MFERVLETVLTKALGEFVQDVDSKNLKLAVWSGNVVLKNLRLKTEALAKFDLPVYVHAGLIGSLELQIPWKALWTAPTRVYVENIVLLVVPKDAAPYSEEKAKEEERQRKQTMLKAVADAQLVLTAKDTKTEKLSWAESLITAIIKNLEIKVQNIHIRYEDPSSGYALGATLDHLFATTTDAMWQPAVIGKTAAQRIFKLAKIENFCVYWNNNDRLLFTMRSTEVEQELFNLIVKTEKARPPHEFVVHPMGCEVKIVIDTNPQLVFDTPKASLSVHFTSLITEVRRSQYLNTMSLIDHMERGKKKAPFAKWHPSVQIKGNAKVWWQYLHKTCIETVIKRKYLNWQWRSIKAHRDNCKEYTALRIKQITGKPSLNELARITALFDILDIVNITICEQNAKIDAQKIISSKSSWFGGWWGGGGGTTSVVDKFGMTSEEKKKMNSVIESSEAAASSQIYPEHYVKFNLKLIVDKVSFKLNNDVAEIIEAAVKDITCEVDIIPYGNGLHIVYQVQTVSITSGPRTQILRPTDTHEILPIFEGMIDINPSDKPADVALRSQMSSVTVLFDMDMINSIIDFQKTDEELTNFDQLRKNIDFYSKRLKSQGKSGLLYAIEKRKIVDINLTLSAPRVIIPQSGKLEEEGPLILADLGRLILTTEVVETRSPKELISMSVEELEEHAYDNYLLNLEGFQVKMFSNKAEWENDLQHSLKSYILCPIKLNVNLSNSILPDDKKLPKIKCRGHVDEVSCIMSDLKIRNLFKIIESLPKSVPALERKPSSIIRTEDVFLDVTDLAATTRIMHGPEPPEPTRTPDALSSPDTPLSIVSSSDEFYDANDEFVGPTGYLEAEGEFVSQTIVFADFTLNRLSLDIVKEGRYDGKIMLKAHVKGIEARFLKTTWMQRIEASVGLINVVDCCTEPDAIPLLASPPIGTLISMSVQMNDTSSPFFKTEFNNTKISVDGVFDKISAKLHIESFLGLYEFGMALLPQTAIITEDTPETDNEQTKEKSTVTKATPRAKDDDVIQMYITATMRNVSVSLEATNAKYSDIAVTDCCAKITMTESTTEITSSLKSIDIKQPPSTTNDIQYSSILSVDSHDFDDLIHFNMVQYKYKEYRLDPDMVVTIKLGSLHFTFLNYYIQNILHVLDMFNNARDRVVAASLETVKYAQESSNSSLISLVLEIKSPVIKIPQNSRSINAYKVVLGNISLKNTFKLTREGVIKDNISVNLSDIAISRVLLGSYGDVLRGRKILEPCEIELSISRYLSNSSDIDVVAALPSLHANLGYEDYHMLLKTLEENLSETGDRVTGVVEENTQTVDEASSSEHSTTTITDGPTITIVAQVAEIVCMLYHSEVALDITSPTTGDRTPGTMIMYSEVRNLGMKLTLARDKHVTMEMKDVRVEDTRADVMDGGIQRILSHKILANEEAQIIRNLKGTSSAITARRAIVPDIKKSMVNLTLDLDHTGDIALLCDIHDPHVVVSWPFIHTLVDFFTVSPYQLKEEAAIASSSRPSSPTSASPPPPPQASQTAISVTLKVANPELAFLGNHASYQTQALLLRTGVELKYKQVGDRTSLQITVEQVMLFICQYLDRLSSIYLLLQPCDVSLIYSKILDERESVNLNVTELVFNISPESLNVMTTVSKQFASDHERSCIVKEHTAYAYNLWNTENIGKENRWYIRQAFGSSLFEVADKFASSASIGSEYFKEIKPLGQILVLNMENFKVTLEADYEPLIVITGETTCSVKDWGGAMLVDLNLFVEVNYYSYNLGTFEPMLEPVEEENGGYRRWNVSCTVKKCPVEVSNEAVQLMHMFGSEGDSEAIESSSVSSLDSMDILDNAPPMFEIHVTSLDKLLLTLTNSALKNLTVLSEAWTSVSDGMEIEPKASTPLMIHNLCGVDIVIRGKDTSQSLQTMTLVHNEKRSLSTELTGRKRLKQRRSTNVITRAPSRTAIEVDDISDAASINVQIEDFEEIKDVKIVQAGLYLYGLVTKVKAKEKREKNVLVEVSVIKSSKSIIIRSPLSFQNLQRDPVRLWYSSPYDSTDKDMVALIQPGDKYSVPLDAPITGLDDSHHFHVTPDDDKYRPSFPSMTIAKLREESHYFVSSYPGGRGNEVEPKHSSFSMVPLKVSNPMRLNLEHAIYHMVSINSPIVVINKLPVPLRVQASGMLLSADVEPGEHQHFNQIDPLQDPYLSFRIINYHDMGFDWSGEFQVNVKKFMEDPNQHVTLTASSNNITNRVTLGITCKVSNGLCMTVFSTYWMVNCTGKMLRYQGLHDSSEILDPPSIQQPMMFSFLHTEKNKHKLRIKVDQGNWSDYFSIDTVGSSGSIRSYDETRACYYEVGVTIAISNIQITNIVTFYPRFQVINELQIPISVKGSESSDQFECMCNKITPFWPGSKNDHSVVITISKGKPTMPIPLDITQQTVVRADCSSDDSCGFISVVVFVDVRTATTEIRVGMYYKGAAPVRIENLLSEASICFRQHEAMHTVTLPKNRSILYTWDYPNKRRELYWYVQDDARHQRKADFIKDNSSTFTYFDILTQKRRKAQLVSFMDGLQRVLLFTDNPAISECVGQEVIKVEQSHLVIELNLMEPIGISLVDSIPQEVVYMQAESSGAIWERKLKHRDRYKYLNTKISIALEEAYLHDKQHVQFDDHTADLSDKEYMKLSFPNHSEALIRRTYLPALWVQYTSSTSQNNIHFRMNRIQIDNQLTDYTFRHVFHPVSPPAHAVATQPPKPFIEFCMVKQSTAVEGDQEQSVLDHYKYVKMLIQEFHIKVDAGFLLSLLNFFKVTQDDEINTEKVDKQWLEVDLKLARTTLVDRHDKEDGGPPVFLDEFHLSPLKIHISFSPQMFIDTTQVQVTEDVLALYLKSYGLGLAAINDAVLKLAYYDATGQLCTIVQLQDRVLKHYVHQTLTQLYAVVFGLDIIGNPYSLAQDIKAGTKDLFYEPYMGIVQGPREFVEGVVIGVNSFLRHSVGGVVGAASKISRSVGKGLAKLTFDEEYQKQRTKRMAQKPTHIGEGLARGGKSFLMGLYHGVTGVIVKPVEGAASDGVEGFFKGVGKGLVGAVTRPLGGINDMITYTIDGIHHHTQVDDQIRFMRHPRYIQPDRILRPYNTMQSEGKYLLLQVGVQHQWHDEYYHHAVLSTKSVFLLTDLRCILLNYDDILNHWKIEWLHLYCDIVKLPVVLNEGEGIGLIFSALMDPNAGVSRFFKNRRRKDRIIILPSSEATQDMCLRFGNHVRKSNPQRFDADNSCWDKCCRCF